MKYMMVSYVDGKTKSGFDSIVFQLSKVIFEPGGKTYRFDLEGDCQCVIGVDSPICKELLSNPKEMFDLNPKDYDRVFHKMFDKPQEVYYHKDLKIYG